MTKRFKWVFQFFACVSFNSTALLFGIPEKFLSKIKSTSWANEIEIEEYVLFINNMLSSMSFKHSSFQVWEVSFSGSMTIHQVRITTFGTGWETEYKSRMRGASQSIFFPQVSSPSSPMLLWKVVGRWWSVPHQSWDRNAELPHTKKTKKSRAIPVPDSGLTYWYKEITPRFLLCKDRSCSLDPKLWTKKNFKFPDLAVNRKMLDKTNPKRGSPHHKQIVAVRQGNNASDKVCYYRRWSRLVGFYCPFYSNLSLVGKTSMLIAYTTNKFPGLAISFLFIFSYSFKVSTFQPYSIITGTDNFCSLFPPFVLFCPSFVSFFLSSVPFVLLHFFTCFSPFTFHFLSFSFSLFPLLIS